MTLKDKLQLFAEGISLYAIYMNSRLGGRAERKWEEWQEQHCPLDVKVINSYPELLLNNLPDDSFFRK